MKWLLFVSVVTTEQQDFIDRLGPYGLEIQACAAEFNFSLGAAVLLNYIYEVNWQCLASFLCSYASTIVQVEAGCTSIIARTPAGEILHGRNLDFNLASVLQNLTCQVTFTKSNQTLYTAVTYAGYGAVDFIANNNCSFMSLY